MARQHSLLLCNRFSFTILLGGAGDTVIHPRVIGQIDHVVPFALAVGVVLHAVERQVVQAHLIVAIAHQHLGDGARHELRDGGRCRQLRGGRGGQHGERAGGEGVEVFAVDHGVEHMPVEGQGGLFARAPFAVFENVQRIYAEGEDLVDGRQFGLGKRWLPTARRRPARRSGPTWGAIEVTSRAFGHTSCLSLLGESDYLEVDDFPYAFSDLKNRPREGNFEGFS